jgi:hypothetical protein
MSPEPRHVRKTGSLEISRTCAYFCQASRTGRRVWAVSMKSFEAFHAIGAAGADLPP